MPGAQNGNIAWGCWWLPGGYWLQLTAWMVAFHLEMAGPWFILNLRQVFDSLWFSQAEGNQVFQTWHAAPMFWDLAVIWATLSKLLSWSLDDCYCSEVYWLQILAQKSAKSLFSLWGGPCLFALKCMAITVELCCWCVLEWGQSLLQCSRVAKAPQPRGKKT